MAPNNTRGTINLKGSAAIVAEFFGFAVQSILYQRGVYPEDKFGRGKKYGAAMIVCIDDKINDYLKQALAQFSEWLRDGELQKLVLVISDVATREVQERWVCMVETDKERFELGHRNTEEKTEEKMAEEIREIMRQIAASIGYLPLLEGQCTFELLAYTKKDAVTPIQWEESDPRLIVNARNVKLSSFSTQEHEIRTVVAYKQN